VWWGHCLVFGEDDYFRFWMITFLFLALFILRMDSYIYHKRTCSAVMDVGIESF